MPQALQLHRHTRKPVTAPLHAPLVALRRKTSSTSLLTCNYCDATRNDEGGRLNSFTCSDCVDKRMRTGKGLTPKTERDPLNVLPDYILGLLAKLEFYSQPRYIGNGIKAVIERKLSELRKALPSSAWPKIAKKKEDLEAEDLALPTPRVLALAKPARAIPNPPPAPPVVFRRIAIAKPAPKTPPVRLANAVFVRTLTANGTPKNKAPLALRKPYTPPPLNPPRPAGAKLSLRRVAPPDLSND